MFKRILSITTLLLCVASIANADGLDISLFEPRINDNAVIIDSDDRPPTEPHFLEMEYLKQKPPINLADRVNRLVYGIKTDIPAEYDIYGHEIRVYMAHVGNPRIYKETEYMQEQIKNVRKAAIVAKFWQEELTKEINQIEKEIELTDAPSAVRSAFRQNKAYVRSFLVDLKGWIDSNERALMNLYNLGDLYYVVYPKVIFIRPPDRIKYYNVMRIRVTNLKEIRKYKGFEIMVY